MEDIWLQLFEDMLTLYHNDSLVFQCVPEITKLLKSIKQYISPSPYLVREDIKLFVYWHVTQLNIYVYNYSSSPTWDKILGGNTSKIA